MGSANAFVFSRPPTTSAHNHRLLAFLSAEKSSSTPETSLDETAEALLDGEKLLDGQSCLVNGIGGVNLTHAPPIRKKDLMPNAPHLSWKKFVTMQEKRVVVCFRFTEAPYLKPYFLTIASKLKKQHSDIIIETRALPMVDANAQPIFELLVDGKVVMGGASGGRERHILGGRVDVANTQSVFVSMEQISLAINKGTFHYALFTNAV